MWGTTAGKLLMTFLIAMTPVSELRGAIPVAVANGLNVWAAIAVAVVGNLVPVPILILFVRRFFNWLRKNIASLNGFVTRLEERAMKKSEVVKKSEFWGLALLVAIPLPGTGAWTGALVAAMLNMRMKRAFPAILLGVVAAGLIIGLLSHTVGLAIG
ncbi:MAG: small multi-drug export protein [Oscillospiraceae bacterium]|nr:small multi-drug export protein [Oscillospiraceae bacterium]MBR2366045.1 small multi-drug export protein [Oscillospiraceae bacterium]MBR2976849.1 small multi-drug export protein [Oscillospiraceae bacterium]